MKFISNYIMPKQKYSEVWVEDKGYEYVGKAKCHPDDRWSNLRGCRIAEKRARIKAFKARYKREKERCEECRKFVRAVEQYATFDPESKSAKAMYRQLNRRIAAVNKLATQINAMEFDLMTSINYQTIFDKKVEKLRNSRNE